MTTQQMLDERYGRVRSRRRRVIGWILVGAIAATAVVSLGWVTVARSIDSVDVAGLSYVVNDDHTVTIGFQLTATPGRDIACALEAQDEDHGIVGWRIVTYPAAQAHTQGFTESIPTVALATTGLVNSCWLT
ncbi:DUF4307 domain-containing protein [Microbacterium sp. NPDC091313]